VDFRKKSTVPISGHPEVEHILPIQLPEKNKEMFLFDLQTVSFSVLKNATFTAEIATIWVALFIRSG
jgi:hypothetical protein